MEKVRLVAYVGPTIELWNRLNSMSVNTEEPYSPPRSMVTEAYPFAPGETLTKSPCIVSILITPLVAMEGVYVTGSVVTMAPLVTVAVLPSAMLVCVWSIRNTSRNMRGELIRDVIWR